MLIDMDYPSRCRRAKPPNYNWTAFCNLFPALPSEKQSKGWMAIAQPAVWRRDKGRFQFQLLTRKCFAQSEPDIISAVAAREAKRGIAANALSRKNA
jgi:hypothetical protein